VCEADLDRESKVKTEAEVYPRYRFIKLPERVSFIFTDDDDAMYVM
jgi:hypothetical protein